mgnify:CR=1 FL=1
MVFSIHVSKKKGKYSTSCHLFFIFAMNMWRIYDSIVGFTFH